MTDDPAFWISVLALLVSIYSAVTARAAKRQARQTALLGDRKQAIEHLDQALVDVRGNHISGDTLTNIRQASHLSRLVFSKTIKSELVSVEVAASSPSVQGAKPNQLEMVALRERLESVISKMTKEAAFA
jgi:hypothetical protein